MLLTASALLPHPGELGPVPLGSQVPSESLGQEATLKEAPRSSASYLELSGPQFPHLQKRGCVLGQQVFLCPRRASRLGVERKRFLEAMQLTMGLAALPFQGPGT